MTMVIFFHSQVESCGGDNGISSRVEVCPSSRKVMAYHQEKEEVCSSYSQGEGEYDHGGHGLCHHLLDSHLLPLLSRVLWRWSWHTF